MLLKQDLKIVSFNIRKHSIYEKWFLSANVKTRYGSSMILLDSKIADYFNLTFDCFCKRLESYGGIKRSNIRIYFNSIEEIQSVVDNYLMSLLVMEKLLSDI